MVEEIKELRPELQPVTFVDDDILEQRQVHKVRPRTPQDIAASRAERAEGLWGEGGRVEPSLNRALVAGQIRIADQIRSPVAYYTQAVVGSIGGGVDRERLPRLLGDDAAHLPIAEHGIERSLPELEWQVVGETDDQPMSDVETRKSAFQGLVVALIEARGNDRVAEGVIVYALREGITGEHHEAGR